jgi:hypothetical protein
MNNTDQKNFYQVAVLAENYSDKLQRLVNDKLLYLNQDNCTIVDIKFSSASGNGFSPIVAMIIFLPEQ